MKRRLAIGMLALALSAALGQRGLCGDAPQSLLTHYTTEQGLSNNAVFRTLCDSRGFVWFFTWNGISRFDGYNFVNYGTAQQTPLVHNRIDRGFEDAYSNFWLVTYTRNLYRFNRHTEEFEDIDRFLPEGVEPRIYRLEAAPDGTVWATLPDFGVICFTTDPATLELTPTLYPVADSRRIKFLHPDPSGLVWFTLDNKLFSISTFERSIYCDLQLDEATVTTIVSDTERSCFGTSDGRLIVRDNRTQSFTEHALQEAQPVTAIALPADGTGDMLVGTKRGSVYRFDGRRFHLLTQCGGHGIAKIMRDSHGLVWLGTSDTGLYKYDPTTGRTRHFNEGAREELTGKNNSSLTEYDGQTWLTLNGGGIFWYDREADRILPLQGGTDEEGTPLRGACTSSCFDRRGDLWFTTTDRGVNRIRFVAPKVTKLPLQGIQPGRAVFVDRDDRLWLSLEEGGVACYDADRRHRRIHLHDDKGQPIGIVYCIAQEEDGTLWFGTKGNGLCRVDPGDGDRLRITRYDYDAADPDSPSHNKIHTILKDSRGRMWIGTYGGGVCLLVREEGGCRFRSLRNDFRSYPTEQCRKVRSLCEDAEGRIWAGTSDGVLILRYDETTHDVEVDMLRRDPAVEHTLPSNDVTCIYRDHEGRMWAGTFGGGISRYLGHDPETGAAQWKSYIENGDRIYTDIKSVTGDDDGTLWLATDTQICALYPASERIAPLTRQEGMPASALFYEQAPARDRSGGIYFAAKEGLYYFRPGEFANDEESLNLQIVDFEIDERPVTPSAEAQSPLHTTITEAREVHIRDGRSLFSFEFAAVNCRLQRHVQYRYRLEGYDRDWIADRGSRKTLYANVPGGRYRFTVRAYLPQSPERFDERSIDVVVTTPFWASWRGMTVGLAAVVLAAILGLLYRNVYRRTLQKRRVIKISPDRIALRDTPDEAFIRQVVGYLEQRFSDPTLKIDDLAQLTHMSRSSFYNRIKELTQMTPIEYLKDFRLRKAEMYLSETKLAISEIAYKAGFTDPAYFTSVFRSRNGITPSEYRRRNARPE